MNQGAERLEASLYVSGDLAQHITLSADRLSLAPGETKYFKVTVKLPQELPPGRHDNRIGAKEEVAGGGMVAAYAVVESQLWIDVPYPGKYIEASLTATNAKVNEDVALTLIIASKGNESLSSVRGAINIYDSSGAQAGTIAVPARQLAPQETAEFNAAWRSGKIGVYTARAVMDYDGFSKTAEAKFKIGDLLAEITGIRHDKITEGEIGKIYVDVESMWAEDIDGAYAEIEVNGQKLRSESVLLPAWGQRTITVFWDTAGLKAGNYQATATLHYSGKTAAKAAVITVLPKTDMMLMLAAAAAILIVLLLMFLRRRRRK